MKNIRYVAVLICALFVLIAGYTALFRDPTSTLATIQKSEGARERPRKASRAKGRPHRALVVIPTVDKVEVIDQVLQEIDLKHENYANEVAGYDESIALREATGLPESAVRISWDEDEETIAELSRLPPEGAKEREHQLDAYEQELKKREAESGEPARFWIFEARDDWHDMLMALDPAEEEAVSQLDGPSVE